MENYEKKYKEALDTARFKIECVDCGDENCFNVDDIKEIFSELAESEDERIRKEMIEILKNEAREFPASIIANKSNSWIDWLEKQKYMEAKLIISDEGYNKAFQDGIEEVLTNPHKYGLEQQGRQKPVKWSEEDEFHLKSIESTVEYCIKEVAENDEARYLFNDDLNWLRSIKDKYLPQPKQEWSEEDETIIESFVALCDDKIKTTGFTDVKEHAEKCRHWLKSLRPQPHWKPSDEQMNNK